MLTTKETLARAREEMLRQLIELAGEGRRPGESERYRERAQHLISELAVNEKAQIAVAPRPNSKYSHHKRPIEAILEYLNDIGRAVPQAKIIQELCDGGFRGGKSQTALAIQKSLRNYLSGTGKKTTRKHPYLGLKEKNSLIGRGDWEDERFVQ